MIKVAFQHWSYVFADEELIRYGSPHFDRKSAGQALSDAVRGGATLEESHSLDFSEKQILSANEAFPESAVADPLADLEVWDEWRSGVRTFPYPGRYGRLGIRQQDAKTNSTSSTGVLGEIMAGLFAQAGVAPWVLVRVINRWPDFIYYLRDDRYAFVESKAFTGDGGGTSGAGLQLPDALLGECVVAAVQQLNADPFVQVWGAFTHIQQISPFQMRVIFLELDADSLRRNNVQKRVLPQPVLLGIAERALRRAITEVEPQRLSPLHESNRRPSKHERRLLDDVLIPAAMSQIEDLLVDEKIRTAVLASPKEIEQEIRRIIKRAVIPEHGEGKKLLDARARASFRSRSKVRTIGAQSLYFEDISRENEASITAKWEPRWEDANKPYGVSDSIKRWRCGGAIFSIGD